MPLSLSVVRYWCSTEESFAEPLELLSTEARDSTVPVPARPCTSLGHVFFLTGGAEAGAGQSGQDRAQPSTATAEHSRAQPSTAEQSKGGGAYFLLMLSVPPADAFRAVEPDSFPRTNLTLLLDSGLTAAVMLTTEVCKTLKLAMGGEGSFSSGVGATGSSLDMQQVRVEGAALVEEGRQAEAASEAQSCPLDPMAGVVVDNFPQLRLGSG
ncbi:unnamed protein product [Symbiodinium sp. CCMP2592]|nr:unnamed protein product [Symbiodinium sp. CCMP2592]